MKPVIIALLLLLIESYCIDATSSNCDASSCLGCTKYSDCVWCDGNCQSKSARIYCSSSIDAPENCTVGCDYNGKHYSVGEEFMEDCNTCTCMDDGSANCTLMTCTPGCDATLCPVNTYCEEKNGHPCCIPTGGNPCNLTDCGDGKVCYIKENGDADCKDDPCMNKRCGWMKICVTNSDGTAACVAPSTCKYNGMTYHEGDSFPSVDGCNQCSCTNYRVVCTLRACKLCQTNNDCDSGFICNQGECYGGSHGNCKTNDDCKTGEFCQKDTCDDTVYGNCTSRIQICHDLNGQVCGCDGKTYADSCAAASAGVNFKSVGECEGASSKVCQLDTNCDTGYFCARNSCDAVNGTCTQKTNLCETIYEPVCGCDGNTYGNACEAARAGVSVKSQGECEGGSQGNGYCKTNDNCESGDYCQKDSCDVNLNGTCSPRIQFCPVEHEQVCGCDGKTYPTACAAASAGVNIKSQGACPCQSNNDCDTGYFCAKNSCDAADGTCTQIMDECETLYEPVCGCDNQTYSNACTANKASVNAKIRGACPEAT